MSKGKERTKHTFLDFRHKSATHCLLELHEPINEFKKIPLIHDSSENTDWEQRSKGKRYSVKSQRHPEHLNAEQQPEDGGKGTTR